MEKFNSPKHAVLRQIADALGLPVERFLTDPASARPTATADECLRLWSRITTEVGRQQALEALRMIADQERTRSEP